MSMHDLKANVDRGTHHEAQEYQKAQMAARAEFRTKTLAAYDGNNQAKGSLHKAALKERSPDDDPVSSERWLTAFAESHGVAPSDAELKEYEDYWSARLKVRPGEFVREGKVKDYARDRWTIDTIFRDAGVNLPGPKRSANIPTVQKAFVTSTTQVIFPFYYAAAIQAGILAVPIVDRLIMEDVPVNSHTADHAMMTDQVADRTTAISGEGAIGVEAIIRATNHPITLLKYKSKVLATYEALRLQRVPIFERGLMRIGQQFMIDITDAAIDVLVNGDGTTVAPGGGAAPTYAAGTTGSPIYKDIVAMDTAFPQGYEMEDGVWIAPIQSLVNILNMPEFKDPLAGWHYQNDGTYPTPIGKEMRRWDNFGRVSNWANTSLMQVKAGIGLVKYTEGGLLVETDRVIDGQWDLVVTSTWTGFAIWDRKACVVGTGFS
jgi:hypothetical protein